MNSYLIRALQIKGEPPNIKLNKRKKCMSIFGIKTMKTFVKRKEKGFCEKSYPKLELSIVHHRSDFIVCENFKHTARNI